MKSNNFTYNCSKYDSYFQSSVVSRTLPGRCLDDVWTVRTLVRNNRSYIFVIKILLVIDISQLISILPITK